MAESMQIKRWTLAAFLGQAREGRALVRAELRALARQLAASVGLAEAAAEPVELAGAPPDKSPGGRKSPALVQQQLQLQLEVAGGQQDSSTLAHGIATLGKLLATLGLYQSAWVLDARVGLEPSRRYALTSYLVLFLGTLAGYAVAAFVLGLSLANVLPALAININRLLSYTVVTSEFCFISNAFVSVAVLNYHRRAVHEFVLYHCSIINLPRHYQRRTAARLFIVVYTLTLCSEPLFVLLSLIDDHKQAIALTRLTGIPHVPARLLTICSISLGSMLVTCSAGCLPFLGCYLIVCTARHLQLLLAKQLAHFNRADQLGLSSRLFRCTQSKQLTQLLDANALQLIKNYSCDTLTLDWPELDDGGGGGGGGAGGEASIEHQDSAVASCGILKLGRRLSDFCSKRLFQLGSHNNNNNNNMGEQRSALTTRACCALQQETGGDLGGLTLMLERHYRPAVVEEIVSEVFTGRAREPAYTQAQYESTAVGLLFLYKNLVKNLSELKGMIAVYEAKFGFCHLMLICLNSFMVAQWVTTALTEARLIRELRAQRAQRLATALAAAVLDSFQQSNATAPAANNATLSSTNHSLAAQNASLSALASNGSRSLWDESQMQADESGDLDSLLTPMGFRVGVTVLMFVILNSYIFLRCDCLPDSLVKMRAQLFRMNIDLACTALEPYGHLRHAARAGSWQRRRPRRPRRAAQPQQQQQQMPSAWCELDQIWSLYDQVARMSELANFRLASGTFYGKRCLLLIFGRTVSLTLLCIQVIDIYSYT